MTRSRSRLHRREHPRRGLPRPRAGALAAALALALAACGSPGSGGPDGGDGDDDAPSVDASFAADGGGPGSCPDASACGDACCGDGETCAYGVCVGAMSCADDDACSNDSYCDPDRKVCVPYGEGPRGDFDDACRNVVVVGVFAPAVQCDWSGPPDGDAFPDHRNVLGTPMVADFDFDDDPEIARPSIVFQSYNGEDGGSDACIGNDEFFGVIRVVSGQDCAQQYTLPEPRTVASSPLAVGDLDGDGRPEIVGHRVGGGLAAFRYAPGADAFEKLWETPSTIGANVCLYSGPSIHDLDDDGTPEIAMGGAVFDGLTGELIDGNLGIRKVSNGQFPTVADTDGDGRPEFVTGDAVFSWNPSGGPGGAGAWEEVDTGQGPAGLVALGDFGTFGADPGGDDRSALDGVPEVAVVSSGEARVQTLAGRTVHGPITLEFFPPADNPGSGGPPTVADFDGDGRAEFAVAGRGGYNVFDPDCDDSPDPDACASGRTDGILWASPTQDYSSSVTGSSVFDFEGDGSAEVVYADECFSRVYAGATGEVLYSQFRTSCTWNENPIVADVDGDFNSEIVIPSNTNCGIGCPALDPRFDGLRCQDDAECPGTTTCAKEADGDDFGRCRCEQDADCGGNGYVCRDPIAGPSAAGKVCRASHPGTGVQGVRVIRDALDRWVNSRPVWNQHAYAVTNVESTGAIPATSAREPNWSTPGLNNFRQNIVGDLETDVIPDATSGGTAFECQAGALELATKICNRGTEPLAPGLPVTFYEGDPAGEAICSETTAGVLEPGQCEQVTCLWDPAPGAPTDVTVVADDDGSGAGQSSECHEGNNRAILPGAHCAIIE